MRSFFEQLQYVCTITSSGQFVRFKLKSTRNTYLRPDYVRSHVSRFSSNSLFSPRASRSTIVLVPILGLVLLCLDHETFEQLPHISWQSQPKISWHLPKISWQIMSNFQMHYRVFSFGKQLLLACWRLRMRMRSIHYLFIFTASIAIYK